MPVRSSSEGILADERAEVREELIEMLKKAYFMEIETVMSYITNSINPDGVRAQEIIESLKEDVQEELGHAQDPRTAGRRTPADGLDRAGRARRARGARAPA